MLSVFYVDLFRLFIKSAEKSGDKIRILGVQDLYLPSSKFNPPPCTIWTGPLQIMQGSPARFGP